MSEPLDRLRKIVAQLREPDGCPWDREQTHKSLREGLLEECYETIDAINRSDDENLREELGDLLLHVVMHSHIASERSTFSLDDVIVNVCEKLIRRHPHVFGDKKSVDTAGVLLQWDEIKRAEKVDQGKTGSLLSEVPQAFPALLRAQKIQKKAASVGFDWPDAAPVLDKIREETNELSEAMEEKNAAAIAEEMGDLLFSVVNLARKLKLNAEFTLTEATDKFVRRFEKVESHVRTRNQQMEDLPLSELDEIWNTVKNEDRNEVRRY
ncbi:MAG: nucleoside triphosphate pyrophosphohydrolase [Chthoniobacterales bacterium]